MEEVGPFAPVMKTSHWPATPLGHRFSGPILGMIKHARGMPDDAPKPIKPEPNPIVAA